MKFTCEKNTLVKEISVAQEIISSRNALSILSNVLLEADNDTLLIRATDLKVGFETRIPVQVDVSGSTTVFCDKFLGILKSLPEGDIHFEQEEGDRLFIRPSSNAIDFQLKSINADKFPEIQDISDDNFFDISQKLFNHMITQTIFSISDDEARYFMNGVFMEKNENQLVMVATDGRRLSMVQNVPENEIQDFEGIIIPPKVLSLMKKLSTGEGNYSLAVADKTLFIKFDNQKLSSTLIEGQFPNYKRVVPDHQEQQAVISKASFTEALKRVSLLAEQKSRRIYVELRPGNVILRSEESEIGVAKEEFDCHYDGPEMTLALNYLYLMDPLRVMDTDNISFSFTDPNRAVTMEAEPGQDYFHIVMPMQME